MSGYAVSFAQAAKEAADRLEELEAGTVEAWRLEFETIPTTTGQTALWIDNTDTAPTLADVLDAAEAARKELE